MRFRAFRSFALATALAAGAVACGGRVARPAVVAERSTGANAPVSEEAFPSALRDLLTSEPGSADRAARLTGVVARQTTRASTRFKEGARTRGASALTGALALVRSGELTPQALGAEGPNALRGMAADVSQRGDDARARAVYELLSRVGNDAERADAKQHIDAIEAWSKDTTRGGPVAVAGQRANAAIYRHLLEPSREAHDLAVARTTEWIEKSTSLRAQYRARKAMPAREEAQEALRALSTGAVLLASIALRNSDVAGALALVDKAEARELGRPDFVAALEGAASSPSADSYVKLVRTLRPQSPGTTRDEEEIPADPDVLRSAMWGVAIEAYRLDVQNPEAAAAVATFLLDFGMTDAAPAVLADASKKTNDPRIQSALIGISLRAMADSIDADDGDAARRAFVAAKPILASIEQKGLASKLNPPPSKLFALAGEVELRDGRIVEARALFEAAAKSDKSSAIALQLARLDAHEGKRDGALARTRAAEGAEDAARDPLLSAELRVFEAELLREGGDDAGAKKLLVDVLRDLTKVRQGQEGSVLARVERLVARALDRFGATEGASRALERALDATPRDKRQAAATVGQWAGSALARGDLKGLRSAFDRALALDLETEDLVYYALWVRLLEKQQRSSADAAAERVLTKAQNDPRWIGRVAAFGAGALKGDALVAQAKTPSQKTEALFYSAMEKRLAGDPKGAEQALKEVVSGGGLELIEQSVAREMLTRRPPLPGPVPDMNSNGAK